MRAVASQAGSAAGWRSARDRASHRETCKDDSLRRDACAAHTRLAVEEATRNAANHAAEEASEAAAELAACECEAAIKQDEASA